MRRHPPSFPWTAGISPILAWWQVAHNCSRYKCHNGQKSTRCYQSHWGYAAWVKMNRLFRNTTWGPKIASSLKSTASHFMHVCLLLEKSHLTYYYSHAIYCPVPQRCLSQNLIQATTYYIIQCDVFSEEARGVFPWYPPYLYLLIFLLQYKSHSKSGKFNCI